jgi:hypothetical protein
MISIQRFRARNGKTRQKIAGKQFTMSTAQVVDVVLVSDDDGVVDGVYEDEAKMMDTVSSTGKTPSGRIEQMERQWRRAARPMTTRRRTMMSWR